MSKQTAVPPSPCGLFTFCSALHSTICVCHATMPISPRCSELEGGLRPTTAFEDGGAARLHHYVPHNTHTQHTMRASLTCAPMPNRFGHCQAHILLFHLHVRALLAEPACAHLKNPAQILAPCKPRCMPSECIR